MEEEEIVEERVHDVKLKEELSKRYLSYAMSTIVARPPLHGTPVLPCRKRRL